ncbi:glycosyltransferase [Methanobacterium sp. MZD130B]|uniref:glycosyltransferase n=1 Tax=Methanobacterium sp. MZD130B TaxID=3394378 RepID=UPI0039FB9212
MKILITSLPDLKKINPQRPHHLIQFLLKEHDITILSVNAWWLNESNDDFLKESLEGVNYYYLTDKKMHPLFQELLSFIRFKKLDLSSYDLHLNLNSLIMGFFISKKMNNLGIQTVFDICDDLPEVFRNSPRLPKFSQHLSVFIGRYMMNKIVKMSSKITYATPSLAKNYDFPNEKSFHIPNGVNVNLFKVRNNDLPKDNTFYMGFVGVLSEWVDLIPAFSALKYLKESFKIKMIVVGDGIKLDEFKKYVIDQGIQRNVVFTGNASYKKVAYYVSLMDVCLISRKTTQDSQNSHPIKLFEYLALEKPVISTPLSGVKDVVGDRIYYASTSDEIEKIIRIIYENQKLTKEIGMQNRKFVVDNYSWHKISSDFNKVLKKEALS